MRGHRFNALQIATVEAASYAEAANRRLSRGMHIHFAEISSQPQCYARLCPDFRPERLSRMDQRSSACAIVQT